MFLLDISTILLLFHLLLLNQISNYKPTHPHMICLHLMELKNINYLLHLHQLLFVVTLVCLMLSHSMLEIHHNNLILPLLNIRLLRFLILDKIDILFPLIFQSPLQSLIHILFDIYLQCIPYLHLVLPLMCKLLLEYFQDHHYSHLLFCYIQGFELSKKYVSNKQFYNAMFS